MAARFVSSSPSHTVSCAAFPLPIAPSLFRAGFASAPDAQQPEPNRTVWLKTPLCRPFRTPYGDTFVSKKCLCKKYIIRACYPRVNLHFSSVLQQPGDIFTLVYVKHDPSRARLRLESMLLTLLCLPSSIQFVIRLIPHDPLCVLFISLLLPCSYQLSQ